MTEDWRTGGIATSHYSRHKAEQEALLDAFERDFPEIPVARVRPGLIFQADALTDDAFDAGSLEAAVLDAYTSTPVPAPTAAERLRQRQDLAAAHAEIYGSLVTDACTLPAAGRR